MKYFSKKSLHDGHHIFFRKSSILGWWEETHLVLIILFSSSLPCFLPPLLPPLLLLFLPSILPSFYYFSHLLFLLILMSYPTLPMWMSSHTVDQIIHYIKFMARWKFEPEIPSMCHLPNKLGLHLPSRASFLNSQKSSLRLVATPPPHFCHRSLQAIPLRSKSIPTHRSVSLQSQYIQVFCNTYYFCLPL